MGETFFCIGANIFRIYLVYQFMKIFYEKSKVDKKIEMIMYSIYFVCNTWLYIEFHLAWINITNTLLGIILLSFLYTSSIKKGFFVSTLIYILNMICDIFSTIPFVNYEDGKNTNQILFVVGDLFFLICERLTEKMVTKKKDENKDLPLILVPICSVGIIFYMTYSGNMLGMEIVVVGMGLLFINFLVLYIYNILLGALSQSYENQILNQKLQMYANQLNLILQNEEKMSALRHDMKHHLNELNFLTLKEENEEIQNYIKSMELFIQNPNEIIYSGNTEIDSLLNYMLKNAKEQLNVADVRVQLPEDMKHSFDINVILGNLLENAIEAACKTPDKILKGSIIFHKGVLKIKLENSYNKNLKRGRDGYVTTKENKREHGIGLKSVQSIVEKYNGAMEISEGELFGITIVLYTSDLLEKNNKKGYF